jgi:hypothetical protein
MPALNFPIGPAIGDVYPVDPGTSGVTQYRYDGIKWNAVTSMVSLGVANQGAYNQYQWPSTSGSPNRQLTTDGAGNLSWDLPAAANLEILGLLEPFDDVNIAFTLVYAGTTNPFTPVPSSNVVIFLGGVPQLPNGVAYSVSGSTVTFTAPPQVGTTFYAISSVVL